VEEDTAAQAAVRNKLRSMLTDTLRAMCTILNHKTTKRTTKESLVNLLVSMPDKLALLAAALCIAGEPGTRTQNPWTHLAQWVRRRKSWTHARSCAQSSKGGP
jgi:hypothetical protein